eukprot:3852428-Karenia_brevis.AAC.1
MDTSGRLPVEVETLVSLSYAVVREESELRDDVEDCVLLVVEMLLLLTACPSLGCHGRSRQH